MRPWNEDIVYMILVDRFHRGGKSTSEIVPPFHGGNLVGIMEKLDYLQDLGVTAIWLSPVFQNQKDGYHGYWPVDFFSVDPRFGTISELVELVNECHRRGVKVLLDIADTMRTTLARDCETSSPNLFERLNELRKEYKTMPFNEIRRKLLARHPSDMRWFSKLLEADEIYPRPDLFAPIIDSHDVARFITEAGDSQDRLRMALTMLLTWRGIPVITYGTECGMSGKTDGANRAPMAFDANPELRDFTCKIIHIRRSNPALTSGATREILADREVFAYLREAGGSKILVVVNNSSHQQERSLEISENGAWINLLDGNEFESAERELKVRLQARSALILQLSQNARAGDIGIA